MRRVCTVRIANNTRARPGARARQRTLIHIETHTYTDTHTHTHTDPGGGSGSARQREPPRKRETRRLVQLCGGRCAPAPTPRSQPVSAGPGYLCGGRVRQLRLPPAPPLPGAPRLAAAVVGTRASVCCLWASASAPRVPPPGTLPSVPGSGKFVHPHSGARHLRLSRRPRHLYAGSGFDFTLLRAAAGAAAAKFRPSR